MNSESIKDKYLNSLKTFDDFVTVSEWAIKFSELYPEELKKAERQAFNQRNETTGLREIAARISSRLARGAFVGLIQIDDSERPKKIKYITKEEQDRNIQIEIDNDLEPLRRQDIINNAKDSMNIIELYRISEFENIQRGFKLFFGIDFEIDHAQALLNDVEQGIHHPNNLQLLLKFHNSKKIKRVGKGLVLKSKKNI